LAQFLYERERRRQRGRQVRRWRKEKKANSRPGRAQSEAAQAGGASQAEAFTAEEYQKIRFEGHPIMTLTPHNTGSWSHRRLPGHQEAPSTGAGKSQEPRLAGAGHVGATPAIESLGTNPAPRSAQKQVAQRNLEICEEFMRPSRMKK
jgi:hypothetical protein